VSAEEVALNRHAIADAPFVDVAPEFADDPGDFGAGRARKLQRNRQPAFFEPQIEPIEAARAHFDDNFVSAGLKGRQIGDAKSARGAVADQLKRAHAALKRIRAAA
jgi:hypothetical protein